MTIKKLSSEKKSPTQEKADWLSLEEANLKAGRVSTGVAGVDEIFSGGFIQRRAYLVRGGPGSGKTTLGLHFLAEGIARGGRTFFISLGETEGELQANVWSLGFLLTHFSFRVFLHNSV